MNIEQRLRLAALQHQQPQTNGSEDASRMRRDDGDRYMMRDGGAEDARQLNVAGRLGSAAMLRHLQQQQQHYDREADEELDDAATTGESEDKRGDRSSPSPVSDEEADGGNSRSPQENFVYQDYSNIKTGDPNKSSYESMLLFGQKLPAKLNAILADPKIQHIVSWMGHGRAWRVHDPEVFVKEVMPRYFQKTNWNSFVRLINAWGFRRMMRGPDRNSYYHELFLRGMPHLHEKMHRLGPKEKKAMADPEAEPNFYDTAKFKPLREPRRSRKTTSSSNADSSDSRAVGNQGLPPPAPAASRDLERDASSLGIPTMPKPPSRRLPLHGRDSGSSLLEQQQQQQQQHRRHPHQLQRPQPPPTAAPAPTTASAAAAHHPSSSISSVLPPSTIRQLAMEEEAAIRMAVARRLSNNTRPSLGPLSAGLGGSATAAGGGLAGGLGASSAASSLHAASALAQQHIPVEPLVPTTLPTTLSGIQQRRIELRLTREELELQLEIVRRQEARLEMLAADLATTTGAGGAAASAGAAVRGARDVSAPTSATGTLSAAGLGAELEQHRHHHHASLAAVARAREQDAAVAAAVAARRGSNELAAYTTPGPSAASSSAASLLHRLGDLKQELAGGGTAPSSAPSSSALAAAAAASRAPVGGAIDRASTTLAALRSRGRALGGYPFTGSQY